MSMIQTCKLNFSLPSGTNGGTINIPICPGSYFGTSITKFKASINWSDANSSGEESVDISSTAAHTLSHTYGTGQSAASVTITINGGWVTSDSDTTGKIAFPKFDDRPSTNSMDRLRDVENTDHLYIHGQGDFRGCSRLFRIKDTINILTSVDPAASISQDNSSSSRAIFKETFKDTKLRILAGSQNFITSKVISVEGMFEGCTDYNRWVRDWDTSNVTSMKNLFKGCTSFNGGGFHLVNWDTDNVTTMESMFEGCEAFNQRIGTGHTAPTDSNPPANWYTNSVTSMKNMFNGCTIFNQSVRDWDTSNVTNMEGMFKDCAAFDQVVAKLSLVSVTTTKDMFSGCSTFNQRVGGFDDGEDNLDAWAKQLGNVTDMSGMFRNCTSFNQFMRDFDISSVTNLKEILSGCTSFNQELNWTTGSVTNMSGMLSGCTSFNRRLNWDTQNVTDMSFMLSGCTAFNSALTNSVRSGAGSRSVTLDGGTIHPWNTENVTTLEGMFKGCSSFNKPNLLAFLDTANVTNFKEFLSGCTSYNQKVLQRDSLSQYYTLDMQSAATVESMFENCTSFNQDVGGFLASDEVRPSDTIWNFKTTGTISMKNMFKSCSSFNKFIRDWDTQRVTDMSGMFYGATSFNQLVNKWDMSNATTVEDMFRGATAFNRNWRWADTSNLTGFDWRCFSQGSGIPSNSPYYNYNCAMTTTTTVVTTTPAATTPAATTQAGTTQPGTTPAPTTPAPTTIGTTPAQTTQAGTTTAGTTLNYTTTVSTTTMGPSMTTASGTTSTVTTTTSSFTTTTPAGTEIEYDDAYGTQFTVGNVTFYPYYDYQVPNHQTASETIFINTTIDSNIVRVSHAGHSQSSVDIGFYNVSTGAFDDEVTSGQHSGWQIVSSEWTTNGTQSTVTFIRPNNTLQTTTTTTTTTTVSTTTTTTTTAQVNVTASYTITSGDGTDYTFSDGSKDPTININVGDYVVFTNQTGGHPLNIKDSSNNIVATPDTSGTWPVTEYSPGAAGTYTYYCTVHPNMSGSIIVS